VSKANGLSGSTELNLVTPSVENVVCTRSASLTFVAPFGSTTERFDDEVSSRTRL